MAHSTLWYEDDGKESGHDIENGGALAYYVSYDVFGNLDTGLPSDASDADKERNANMLRGLKVLDTRIMTTHALTVVGVTVAEEDLAVKEINGHAVWFYEGDYDGGSVCGYGIPFDNHIVTFVVTGAGDSMPDAQRGIIDSISFTDEADEKCLSIANDMKGKTQQEATQVVVGLGSEPVSSSASSSSTGGTNTSSVSTSNRSTSGSSADDDFEIVDSGYDDARGKGYKGSDGNYYFKNDDGTYEATDGKGNGVRDLDGDGEPDEYTTDSGKTWHKL